MLGRETNKAGLAARNLLLPGIRELQSMVSSLLKVVGMRMWPDMGRHYYPYIHMVELIIFNGLTFGIWSLKVEDILMLCWGLEAAEHISEQDRVPAETLSEAPSSQYQVRSPRIAFGISLPSS